MEKIPFRLQPGNYDPKPLTAYSGSKSGCNLCNDLSSGHGQLQYQLWANINDLTSSANSGCLACQMLVEACRTHYQGADYQLWVRKARGSSLTIRNMMNKDGVEIFLKPGATCAWDIIEEFSLPFHEPKTRHTFIDFAIGQMKTCRERHSECVKSDQTSASRSISKLPARLLRISGDAMSLRLRLVSTNDLDGSSLKYIALSHCWGVSQIITTTSLSYSHRCEDIDWVDLSKTFQDAATVSHALGILYIWIDSLCIIQDSLEDWAIESAKMADTYSNAWLTLAATGSAGGVGGMFFDRPKLHELAINSKTTGSGIFVRRATDHEALWNLRSSSRHLPLTTRGWTLQEQLLSIRVLHFTREELVWDCRTQIVCECGGPELDISDQYLPGQSLSLSNRPDFSRWADVVHAFSERRLTYDRDRLPALSGLASRHMSKSRGRYIAGLREADLPTSLLWYTATTAYRSISDDTGVSYPPTWSWASIEVARATDVAGVPPTINKAEVSDDTEMLADIVHCDSFPSTVDPNGMVAGGTLSLRARLMPLRVGFEWIEWPFDEAREREEQREDSEIYMFTYIISERETLRMWALNFNPDIPLTSKENSLEPGDVVYFAPILIGGQLVRGIMLRKADTIRDQRRLDLSKIEGGKGDVYCRIGEAGFSPSNYDGIELGKIPKEVVTII